MELLELTGKIKYEIWASERITESTDKAFEMRIAPNGNWSAKVDLIGSGTTMSYAQISNLLFSVFEFKKTKGSNDASGSVSPDLSPQDDGTCMNYLWLAYLKIPELQSKPTNLLAPIWTLDDSMLKDNGFQLPIKFSKNASGLIWKLEFLNDGVMRFESGGKRFSNQIPPPFAGFTNAFYRSDKETTMGDWRFPLEFQFQRNYFNGSAVLLRTLTKCSIDAYRLSNRPITAPSYKGLAFTIDSRFGPQRKVTYSYTNGYWPTPTEVTNRYVQRYRGAEAIGLKD